MPPIEPGADDEAQAAARTGQFGQSSNFVTGVSCLVVALAILVGSFVRCRLRGRHNSLAARLKALGIPTPRIEEYIRSFENDGLEAWAALAMLKPTAAELQARYGLLLGHSHVLAQALACTKAPKLQTTTKRAAPAARDGLRHGLRVMQVATSAVELPGRSESPKRSRSTPCLRPPSTM